MRWWAQLKEMQQLVASLEMDFEVQEQAIGGRQAPRLQPPLPASYDKPHTLLCRATILPHTQILVHPTCPCRAFGHSATAPHMFQLWFAASHGPTCKLARAVKLQGSS